MCEFVEERRGARADQALEALEIVRPDDRLHRLALQVVLGRVHRDEHRQLEVFVLVDDGDAALGGEDAVAWCPRS